MHRIGRLHFQRLMAALAVVDPHRLTHHAPGLLQVGGPLQQQLAFEDAVDPLGQRILVAVLAIGH